MLAQLQTRATSKKASRKGELEFNSMELESEIEMTSDSNISPLNDTDTNANLYSTSAVSRSSESADIISLEFLVNSFKAENEKLKLTNSGLKTKVSSLQDVLRDLEGRSSVLLT